MKHSGRGGWGVSLNVLYQFLTGGRENWNSGVTGIRLFVRTVTIYSAGREKCRAGPSACLIRAGPIKLSSEINLPLVCGPVIGHIFPAPGRLIAEPYRFHKVA